MRNRATKLPVMALENKSDNTRKAQVYRWEVAKKPRLVLSAAGAFPCAGKAHPDTAAEFAEFPICDRDVRSRCDYFPPESRYLRFESGVLRQQQGCFSCDFGWVRNCKTSFLKKVYQNKNYRFWWLNNIQNPSKAVKKLGFYKKTPCSVQWEMECSFDFAKASSQGDVVFELIPTKRNI